MPAVIDIISGEQLKSGCLDGMENVPVCHHHGAIIQCLFQGIVACAFRMVRAVAQDGEFFGEVFVQEGEEGDGGEDDVGDEGGDDCGEGCGDS